MAEIETTNGMVAVVDDADVGLVSSYRWFAERRPNGLVYARASSPRRLGRPYMHRLILGPGAGRHSDHVDGNGLNNRRSNLRPATVAQNIQNGRRHRDGSSRFKGVGRRRKGGWMAQIGGAYLGTFADEEDAARAYDRAARDRFGEFARLNFPG